MKERRKWFCRVLTGNRQALTGDQSRKRGLTEGRQGEECDGASGRKR